MDHVDTDYTFAQSVTVSADFARQLERELNDAKETIDMMETRHGATMLCHQAQMDVVTNQRDTLAFSIRFALANSLADSKSETILRQALETTKGGQHE